MCGRFFLEVDIEDIISFYGIGSVDRQKYSKGEIFPGTNIPVVFKEKEMKMDYFRWGFQVSHQSLNKEVINARLETAAEKSTFKSAFYDRRCIIPANAFFEWKTIGKAKEKYKISVIDRPLFSMAGIYEEFVDKNNNTYYGVVILTKQANEEMSKLHHRMPVILANDEAQMWLTKDLKDMKAMEKRLEEAHTWLQIASAENMQQMSLLDML